MYSIKHLWKIKKSSPAILVIVGIFILYQKLNNSSHTNHASIQDRYQGELAGHVIPTDTPMVNAWVVAFTDVDLCLSIATTFSPWTVFLVGNCKEPPKELRHSRCIYSTSVQDDLKHAQLSQRNLAMIFAIKRGAEAIYILPNESKDRNFEFPTQLSLGPKVSGMKLSAGRVFHPVHHWGCNISQTKQFPQETDIRAYKLCDNIIPAIQAQANEVIRGTEGKHEQINPKTSCDSSSPAVVLSQSSAAYFEARGTLYLKNALWALAFAEVENTKERFYTSVLIQRLIALSGQQFFVYLGRNITLHETKGAISDKDINSILNSSCMSEKFIECVAELTGFMKENGQISQDTMVTIKQWLNLLHDTGYNVEIKKNADNQFTCMQQQVTFQPVDHNVAYSIKKWKPEPFPPVNNIRLIQNLHRRTCANISKNSGVHIDFYAPWVQWENMLLIVVFNNPHYDVIQYTELLYRSFFPRILYCGPGYPDVDMLGAYTFSFVSFGTNIAGHLPGSFNYRCLSMAVKMNYKVSGYFVISDDTLVIPEKMHGLNQDKVWYMPSKEIKTADILALRECRLGMCDFHTHWRWWEDYQSATVNAIKELKSKIGESRIIHNCYQTLKHENGGDFHVNGAYSDVFYIPGHWARDFATLADVFLKHYVFVEIAIPTIMKCLVPAGETAPLIGKQIWDESRDKSWVHFTKRDMLYQSYLHPTKWGYVSKGSQEYREFLCNAISYVHDPYGRVNKIQGL